MNEKLEELSQAIKNGKRKIAVAIVNEIKDKYSAADILNALLSAMTEIGAKFKANEIFVPEVLVSARAMKSCMEILEPKLVASGLEPTNCIVIGTVEGDLHDIGKNLVAMMLKGANFKVVDIGVNATFDDYYKAAKENKADIVAMSALLTTTMTAMQATVEKFKNSDLSNVKVIIGGAPVTQEYADKIGATGYSKDAASAVDLCKNLLNIAS